MDAVTEALEKCNLNSKCNKILIETKNINAIMSEYFGDSTLFLISLDVEGLDKEILESFDFKRFRPVSSVLKLRNYQVNIF